MAFQSDNARPEMGYMKAAFDPNWMSTVGENVLETEVMKWDCKEWTKNGGLKK